MASDDTRLPQYQSQLVKEFLIHRSYVNTVHTGLDKSYVELCDKHHWQNTYSDTEEFVDSRELCQLTKSSPQKPMAPLIPFNVPTRA